MSSEKNGGSSEEEMKITTQMEITFIFRKLIHEDYKGSVRRLYVDYVPHVYYGTNAIDPRKSGKKEAQGYLIGWLAEGTGW